MATPIDVVAFSRAIERRPPTFPLRRFRNVVIAIAIGATGINVFLLVVTIGGNAHSVISLRRVAREVLVQSPSKGLMELGIVKRTFVATSSPSPMFRPERYDQVEARPHHRQELSVLTGQGKLGRLRSLAGVRQILRQGIVVVGAPATLNGGGLATTCLGDRPTVQGTPVVIEEVLVVVAKVQLGQVHLEIGEGLGVILEGWCLGSRSGGH